MVVISILTIVIGMSATSLATLYRLHRRYARDTEQALVLDRLAMRLRSDAHEAVSVSLDDGCTLELADGRSIHYSMAAPRIIRQVKRDASVLHHDTFLMPRDAVVEFAKEGTPDRTLIRLSVRPGEFKLPARELPRSTTMEAAVRLLPGLAQDVREP